LTNAHATWIEKQRFDGVSDSGHTIVVDGDKAAGNSPMELVLIALCGCTGYDVVSILQKKREPFTSLEVRARAERAARHEHPGDPFAEGSESQTPPELYAVRPPGSAPDTKAVRNLGPAMKLLMIPLVKLIPGMSQTPETAARRYLQASAFGTDVSGQFFASAPKKLTGPIEAMRHPHLHDRANQEAAWQAVVKVSGVDFSSAAT